LHVDGSVNIKAYISSNFAISGFFSGGGYGMGLVDIDQNNNEVQEFLTQTPYTQGSTPFTAIPTQYSLSTTVDYTFKAGHSLGFAVGVGATTQGFTATVYFDSSNYNSGATLPIEDVMSSSGFSVDYGGVKQNLAITSDSAISNCQFTSGSGCLQFTAQGISGTTGSCIVSVPKTFMQAPFKVTLGTQQITPTITENSTCTQLSFSHTRSTTPLQITGALNTNPTASPSTQPSSQPTTTATISGASTSPTNSATSPSATSTSPTQTSSPTNSPSIPEYVTISFLAAFIATAAVSGILKKRMLKQGKYNF
jgi:hypothetical protein